MAGKEGVKASYEDGALLVAKVLMGLDEHAVERAFLVVGVDKYQDGKVYFVAHLVGDRALVEEAVREMARKSAGAPS